ncbi:molybdate ABC transporter permease [Enterovibrio norvegicus FF-33]|uniref:Molybdenum transport system permease n=1 Tax=Enterovibrio norvegicus FF-454 TaxID=1185651 RepID=A0A1E5CBU3_9GAMM|nr:molybdate ABC transporter permease subunit [Enterovibrio norvegicus]OEE62925.1 molybdate ABC transporter permease [Enterovibrio norvegicus FF-454]OEE66849.1 molybdate ABC transporter permease [Enterovibrio norvegicus FF-33]OEE75017.1 molybdate ABC transporter permease [Enterovibrio norvegicus FF-162]
MFLTPVEWEALSLSLKISLVAVAVSLPLGIAVAWVLARKQFVGKSLLDGFIHLPLVLPPVVIGYLLLVVMGRRGVVGQWLYDTFGVTFSFSWKGAALASAVVAFPLLVRAIRLSLELVDQRLEEAARTLGASRWRVFYSVTLPLIAPGILSGFVLAFARSLGEFGATITFVSNIPGETQTIPLAMFAFLETPGAEQSVARLCAISIVIALLSLFGSEWLSRRMKRRMGIK